MTCNLCAWLKAYFTDCLGVLDLAHFKLNIIREPGSLGCRKVERGYLQHRAWAWQHYLNTSRHHSHSEVHAKRREYLCHMGLCFV